MQCRPPPPTPRSRTHLVAQELAGQTPEGVQVEEAAGQVDQLELFHVCVDENLRGGEGRNPRPGGVGHVDACGGRRTTGFTGRAPSLGGRRSSARQRRQFGRSATELVAFEVVLVGEAQGDAVAVAPGGPAVLGDAGAEARHAASLHAEVAFSAVSCVGGKKKSFLLIEFFPFDGCGSFLCQRPRP